MTSRVLLFLLLATGLVLAEQPKPNMSALTDQTVAEFAKGTPNRATMAALVRFYRNRASSMKYEVELAEKRRRERGVSRPTTLERQYAYFVGMADLFTEADPHARAIQQARYVSPLAKQPDLTAHRAALKQIAAQVADIHAKSPFKKRNS